VAVGADVVLAFDAIAKRAPLIQQLSLSISTSDRNAIRLPLKFFLMMGLFHKTI